MFDIGFSELLVIAVVALLVLGPERLPKAARFAGLWMRRARSHWHSVKSEFENELASEDLQRSLRETREALRSAEEELRGGATALQAQLDDAQAELEDLRADATGEGRRTQEAASQETPEEESERLPSQMDPDLQQLYEEQAGAAPHAPPDDEEPPEPSPQEPLPFPPAGEPEAPTDARR